MHSNSTLALKKSALNQYLDPSPSESFISNSSNPQYEMHKGSTLELLSSPSTLLKSSLSKKAQIRNLLYEKDLEKWLEKRSSPYSKVLKKNREDLDYYKKLKINLKSEKNPEDFLAMLLGLRDYNKLEDDLEEDNELNDENTNENKNNNDNNIDNIENDNKNDQNIIEKNKKLEKNLKVLTTIDEYILGNLIKNDLKKNIKKNQINSSLSSSLILTENRRQQILDSLINMQTILEQPDESLIESINDMKNEENEEKKRAKEQEKANDKIKDKEKKIKKKKPSNLSRAGNSSLNSNTNTSSLSTFPSPPPLISSSSSFSLNSLASSTSTIDQTSFLILPSSEKDKPKKLYSEYFQDKNSTKTIIDTRKLSLLDNYTKSSHKKNLIYSELRGKNAIENSGLIKHNTDYEPQWEHYDVMKSRWSYIQPQTKLLIRDKKQYVPSDSFSSSFVIEDDVVVNGSYSDIQYFNSLKRG